MSSSTISIKAKHGSIIRRFSVPSTISYDAFRRRILTSFAITSHATLSYVDTDADICTLSDASEFAEMLTQPLSPVRITVNTPDTSDINPQTTSRAVPAPAAEPQPALEPPIQPGPADVATDIMQSVADFVSAVAGSAATFRGPPHRRRSFGRHAHHAHGHHRHGHHRHGPHPFAPPPPPYGAYPPFMGMFQAFAPFMGLFGRTCNSGAFSSVSQETKMAFRAVKAAVRNSDSEALMHAIPDVAPPVVDWMKTNMTDTEQASLSADAIAQVKAIIHDGLAPHAGENVMSAVDNLVNTALNDPAVISMLRSIPWNDVDLSAHFGSNGARPRQMPSGFDVHRRFTCDVCDKSPIIGARYKATNTPNYDMCSECYENDAVSKEGKEFTKLNYIWEAELGDALVPPAPLMMGDRGPAVAFLQKILTDLGYMNANMYSRRVGMFGANTRAAVQHFQTEYGLDSVTNTGQYDATTAASLTSLLDRAPPTAAAGAGLHAAATASSSANQPEPDSSAAAH